MKVQDYNFFIVDDVDDVGQNTNYGFDAKFNPHLRPKFFWNISN